MFDKLEEFKFETVEDILSMPELDETVDQTDNIYVLKYYYKRFEEFYGAGHLFPIAKNLKNEYNKNPYDVTLLLKLKEIDVEWKKRKLIPEAIERIKEQGNVCIQIAKAAKK